MELRHVRYFVAAVEEGSLQGAARRVHVAQPALSRQIHDLEEMLGCVLFERHAKGVQLTAAGAAFHRDALAILQLVAEATQRSRKAGLAQQQRVRLGLVRTVGKYAFTHRAITGFMRGFTHERPDMPIEFTRASSPELAEALRDGRLDLALIYERQLDPRSFGQRIVHHESYVLATHPQHRLARQSAIHLADLAGEPLVWLSRRNNADNHDALLQHCRLHGLEPVIRHEADSHDEQIELVGMTAGICLTVASTQLTAAPGQLLFRPISDFDLEVQLRLAWRKGMAVGSAAALQQSLMAAIDEHQAELAHGGAAWTRIGDSTVVRPGR
jgi:DNA-binding transcriptional LysR family regulator